MDLERNRSTVDRYDYDYWQSRRKITGKAHTWRRSPLGEQVHGLLPAIVAGAASMIGSRWRHYRCNRFLEHLYVRALPLQQKYTRHLAPSRRSRTGHSSAMFGASEDRARQLAYRKRRERVISGSLSTACRSCSFSSQLSHASRASSFQAFWPSPSTITPEHSYLQAYRARDHDLIPAKHIRLTDPVDYTSIVSTNASRFQEEQHRLQAEYLSRVLYDSLSLDNTNDEQLVHPVAAIPSGPPAQSSTLRHVRHVTAPVGFLRTTELANCPPLHQPLLPFVSNVSVKQQDLITLRGGGTPNHQSEGSESSQSMAVLQATRNTAHPRTGQPLSPYAPFGDVAPYYRQLVQRYIHKRPYMLNYPWSERFMMSPACLVPISTGLQYEHFKGRLSSNLLNTFSDLFSSMQPANDWTAPIANIRREFYQKLNQGSKNVFQCIIMSRKEELSAIEKGEADPQQGTQTSDWPSVMLCHLLEATEPLFLPTPEYFVSRTNYNTHMSMSTTTMRTLDGRATSVPDLRQQQQQWYAVSLGTN